MSVHMIPNPHPPLSLALASLLDNSNTAWVWCVCFSLVDLLSGHHHRRWWCSLFGQSPSTMLNNISHRARPASHRATKPNNLEWFIELARSLSQLSCTLKCQVKCTREYVGKPNEQRKLVDFSNQTSLCRSVQVRGLYHKLSQSSSDICLLQESMSWLAGWLVKIWEICVLFLGLHFFFPHPQSTLHWSITFWIWLIEER